jgi:hypothetical protein
MSTAQPLSTGEFMHKRIFVVDIEASGFEGYPIEIGWSAVGSGVYRSLLVSPAAFVGGRWDPISEEVHGISIEMLQKDGMDPDTIIFALLKDTDGCLLISDAPEFDQAMLDQLIDASFLFFTTKERGEEGGGVVIQSVQSVFPSFDIADFDAQQKEKEHRAGPDALLLATYLGQFGRSVF